MNGTSRPERAVNPQMTETDRMALLVYKYIKFDMHKKLNKIINKLNYNCQLTESAPLMHVKLSFATYMIINK